MTNEQLEAELKRMHEAAAVCSGNPMIPAVFRVALAAAVAFSGGILQRLIELEKKNNGG